MTKLKKKQSTKTTISLFIQFVFFKHFSTLNKDKGAIDAPEPQVTDCLTVNDHSILFSKISLKATVICLVDHYHAAGSSET